MNYAEVIRQNALARRRSLRDEVRKSARFALVEEAVGVVSNEGGMQTQVEFKVEGWLDELKVAVLVEVLRGDGFKAGADLDEREPYEKITNTMTVYVSWEGEEREVEQTVESAAVNPFG